jgi:hypothetical protein
VLSQSVKTGEWVLLSAHIPGRAPVPIGILLRDPTDGLHVKLRRDWTGFTLNEAEIDVWGAMSEDLEEKGRHLGGTWLLDWLEDTASHSVQIGAREFVEVTDPQRIVGELYQRYVEFRTVCKCQIEAK